MCLWVERAHLRTLLSGVRAQLREIREAASERATDLLFQLPSAMAEPAIIFRDFPKRHGNIIQKAVGIALQNHAGGFTQTSARFPFLSGLTVEVDNFFMNSNGAIYLFETKRDQKNVREEGVAGRNLSATKDLIEHAVLARTGKRLRHPIQIAYFSYIDEKFDGAPRDLNVNIGSKAAPQIIKMPIYSREDMNNLIGPCFGQYLRVVDREIDKAIAEQAPELTNLRSLHVSPEISFEYNDDVEGEHSRFLQFGDPPHTREPSTDGVLV
jgi:hypothetical protein